MRSSVLLAAAAISFSFACGNDAQSSTEPPSGDQFTLSSAQFNAMVDRGEALADDNPGNASLRSFVDSTLQALQAGVEMKRLDVVTNLTDKPLYFIGIHRVSNQANGSSFSTWTLIGFEDPANFTSVVQTSGFAQSSTGTAPSSVSGPIGDGSGIINGQLLLIGANGTVSTFNYSSGSASFRSDAQGAQCPKINPSPATVCTIETMHVTFTVSATQSPTGSLMKQASVTTEVSVPAMRLTYTP
jgi:hypothetical protein